MRVQRTDAGLGLHSTCRRAQFPPTPVRPADYRVRVRQSGRAQVRCVPVDRFSHALRKHSDKRNLREARTVPKITARRFAPFARIDPVAMMTGDAPQRLRWFRDAPAKRFGENPWSAARAITLDDAFLADEHHSAFRQRELSECFRRPRPEPAI